MSNTYRGNVMVGVVFFIVSFILYIFNKTQIILVYMCFIILDNV